MVNLRINGLDVQVEPGTTVLEAAQFLGIKVPTLCHRPDLTPYGACRLCIVEIGTAPRSKLVSSCTYPATEGLEVRTHSQRVVDARKVVIELLLATCPTSKTIQDLAARNGVQRVRFAAKHEDCILCGLCTRICDQQMDARAIGFVGRGTARKITTPFRAKSAECRTCGACIWVCPACQERCQASTQEGVVCGSCLNTEPVCLEGYDDAMCYLDPCCWCVKETVKSKASRAPAGKAKKG